MLRGTSARVTGITAHGTQNGIGLVDASDTYVADNDLADNTGWAIHLFRSSHNTISGTTRPAPPCSAPDADCSAAAILLREGSDSNTIAENDLTRSTIGVLVTGPPPLTRPSVGNLIYRNDASLAAVAAFRRGSPGASPSWRTGRTAPPPASSWSG